MAAARSVLASISALASGPISNIALLLASSFTVIDGDTIRQRAEAIRILNINAPKIPGAKCDAELRLGLAAKAKRGHNGRHGPTLAHESCFPQTSYLMDN